jgi:hypothetical protein
MIGRGWGFGTTGKGVGQEGVGKRVGGDLWRGPFQRHGAKRERPLTLLCEILGTARAAALEPGGVGIGEPWGTELHPPRASDLPGRPGPGPVCMHEHHTKCRAAFLIPLVVVHMGSEALLY